MEHKEVDQNPEAPSTSSTLMYRSTGSGSDKRLVEIFEKEIDREIAERMGSIAEIADNIKKCQQTLDRLRKEAVVKYYMTSLQSEETDEQPSIHPAVKKIIGKRPRDMSQTEQFMTSNIAEWKRETRKKHLNKNANYHKNTLKSKVGDPTSSKLLIEPRYVPPNIPGNPQENSSLRGNTKKMHMRVLVGNVAKQIETDGEAFDPATHKWMVYVRSAPGSLAVEREVARVHFFLHPSYKPHDIVTVPSAPFTLNRRGWGEFPMRVQLHFKNRLNKPADIIHHLKLNGARSGHHTRSAETFADLWLYPYEREQENKVDKDSSGNILLLASDMLKEDVPDFTSEVICSRCQTTSQSTDSRSCTCGIKDSTRDSGSDSDSDQSSESSVEESDSDDSTEDSVLPKPLTCWDVPSDIDMAEVAEAILKEEIKDEQVYFGEGCSGNVNTLGVKEEICSAVVDEKQNGQLIKDKFPENESSSKGVEEVGSKSTIPNCFNSSVSRFAKMESDFLNVEASDIMDALEIKQEPKETEENDRNFNEVLGKIKVEDDNQMSIYADSSLSPLEKNDSSESQEKPMFVDNKISKLDNKITLNNNEISSKKVMPESEEIGDTKLSNSDDSSLIFNGSTDSILDSCMIIEEVPIDEFINNIVEEEIIVEDPEVPAVNEIEKSEIESQLITFPSTTQPSVEKSPFTVTESPPCTVKTAKVIQNNTIISKTKEVPQIKTSTKQPSFEKSPFNVAESPPCTVKTAKVTKNNTIVSKTKEVPLQVKTSTKQQSFEKSPFNVAESAPCTIETARVIQNKTILSKTTKLPPQVKTSTKQPSFEKSPFIITDSAPFTKDTAKFIQNNAITSKAKEVPPQVKTVFVSGNPENASKSSNKLLVNSLSPNSSQPMKAISKHVKVQPIQQSRITTDSKDLLVNGSGCVTPTVLKLNPRGKEVSVKSPRIIKFSKEDLITKRVILHTNQPLKKLKTDHPNQLENTQERSLLSTKGLFLVQSVQLNNAQIEPKNDKTNNNSLFLNATKSTVVQTSSLTGSTQKTSLLKPQFQSNAMSKLNTRNPNPNSLLRPIIAKPATPQSNTSNQQILQKSASQVLPSTRLLTYSFLKSTNNNVNAQSRIKIQNSSLNSVDGITSKSINTTQNCTNSLVKAQLSPQGHKTIISTKVNQSINTYSCNQSANSMIGAPQQSLGQEILKLSTNVFKKEPKPLEIRETSLPNETSSRAQNQDAVECCAPDSFSRKMYSISDIQKSNGFVNTPILKGNLENKTNPCEIGVVKETVSFSELLRIIHFPKTSIPSRPANINSGWSDKKELRTLDLDCVLSCNSMHNDLQEKYLVQPESQFGRKSVMISKDQVNSTVNDQIMYYLEQLRLLVNTCGCAGTEAAVRWLVRGLPLTRPDARLVAYKTVHPYCATSRHAYCSWPAFKQQAAEWLRAKTVVRILSALRAKGVLLEDVWSTRKVYWWCRTHGYSPAFCLIGPESTENNKDWIQKVEHRTSPTKVLEWVASVRPKVRKAPEEEVDIQGLDSQEGVRGGSSRGEVPSGATVPDSDGLICGRPWVRDLHGFIVNQVGRLGAESLVEGGPPRAAAGTLLAHAAAGLAEDLLRRGLAHAARRGGGCLEPQDVCRAILKRQEFDIFTGQGLDVDLTFREYLRSLPSLEPP